MPSFAIVVDFAGDADVYPWPNGDPCRCLWTGSAIVANPALADLAAINSRIATDESERVSCKQDASIIALINQTKAEWISWVTANFPSITTAGERTRLGTLFWVVAIAVRRLVRNGGS